MKKKGGGNGNGGKIHGGKRKWPLKWSGKAEMATLGNPPPEENFGTLLFLNQDDSTRLIKYYLTPIITERQIRLTKSDHDLEI